jgi:pterin-4a-carbinolamine dehydratase
MLVKNLMKEYFDDNVNQDNVFDIQGRPGEQPIVPIKNEWTVLENPRRYYRKYMFKTNKLRNLFLIEVLKTERDTGHDIDIRLTKNSVSIETYTHNVNDITEIDVEMSREFDNIYVDVKNYEINRTG